MNIEKRLVEHYKRWNITFSYEEEFINFKNRLITTVNQIFGTYLAEHDEIDEEFRKIIDKHKAKKPIVKKSEIVIKRNSLVMKSAQDTFKSVIKDTELTPSGFGDTYIFTCLDSCKSLQELATNTQIFFWAIESKYGEVKKISSDLIDKISSFSSLTPSAGFRIQSREEHIIIYPPGDVFLDSEIIDYTLAGLGDYPEAAKSFEKALEMYLGGDASNYRSLLDNLRFSLEQLLRKILGNQNSLEKQHVELKKWLTNHRIHSSIISCYKQLFNHYRLFQNDASKHDENFSGNEIEVEFMIYLTGNFMRLLIHLAKKIE